MKSDIPNALERTNLQNVSGGKPPNPNGVVIKYLPGGGGNTGGDENKSKPSLGVYIKM